MQDLKYELASVSYDFSSSRVNAVVHGISKENGSIISSINISAVYNAQFSMPMDELEKQLVAVIREMLKQAETFIVK